MKTTLAIALGSIASLATACASAPCPAQDAAPPAAAAAPSDAAADPLAAITLAPLPDWTDKYADYEQGDARFFEIEALMTQHGLARWQAVAVQNHYRDLSRAGADGGPAAWFAEALRRVRAGEIESGYDAAAFAAAPFIVVFDLDDTLYDQYAKVCHDLVAPQPDGSARNIQRAPGWEEAFARIRELGGAIAIFSANLDDRTMANMRAWRWEDRPLTEHPDVDAIMTNSHLVRQSTHEGAGRAKRSKGQPVMEASKDLRIFDESLERVVLVDDNPWRVFHHGNLRVPENLRGDSLCGDDADPAWVAAQRAQLGKIVDELAESLAYAKKAGVPFAVAYRPYTLLGQEAVHMLTLGGAMPDAAAIAWLRAHPGAIE